MTGRIQFWLQRRRFPLWLLGNLLSDVRYWRWRARGGKFPNNNVDHTGGDARSFIGSTSSNTPRHWRQRP